MKLIIILLSNNLNFKAQVTHPTRVFMSHKSPILLQISSSTFAMGNSGSLNFVSTRSACSLKTMSCSSASYSADVSTKLLLSIFCEVKLLNQNPSNASAAFLIRLSRWNLNRVFHKATFLCTSSSHCLSKEYPEKSWVTWCCSFFDRSIKSAKMGKSVLFAFSSTVC